MLKYADRIRETTTTTGTGSLVLAGATLGGFEPFSSFLANLDDVAYCVVDPLTGIWEAGYGVYSSGPNAIVRTAPGVFAGSSGAGVLVVLPAGSKEVFNEWPAVPVLLAATGTVALPGLALAVEPALGLTRVAAGILALCAGALDQLGIKAGFALLKNTGLLGWTSGALSAAVDVALGRAVAGVVRATDGAGGVGWLQSPAGEMRLAANFTTAGTAMLSIGFPTVNLKAGRSYAFEVVLIGNDATAAQGVQMDMNGGTATVTSFVAQALIHDTILQASEQSASLANAFNAATWGTGQVSLKGTLVVNVAGTLIPRAAKNSAGAATLTLLAGSYMIIADIT